MKLTGNAAVTRMQHTVSMLASGKVLVAGGLNGVIFLNSAELYNPSTGTWTTAGDMNIARSFHTASVLPDGRIIIVGRDTGSISLNSAELCIIRSSEPGHWQTTWVVLQLFREQISGFSQQVWIILEAITPQWC